MRRGSQATCGNRSKDRGEPGRARSHLRVSQVLVEPDAADGGVGLEVGSLVSEQEPSRHGGGGADATTRNVEQALRNGHRPAASGAKIRARRLRGSGAGAGQSGAAIPIGGHASGAEPEWGRCPDRRIRLGAGLEWAILIGGLSSGAESEWDRYPDKRTRPGGGPRWSFCLGRRALNRAGPDWGRCVRIGGHASGAGPERAAVWVGVCS